MSKNLYLLRAIATPSSPFYRISYDVHSGFVVRAETEDEARDFANKEVSNEREYGLWLNPVFSTCVQLNPDGEPGVILKDYYEG